MCPAKAGVHIDGNKIAKKIKTTSLNVIILSAVFAQIMTFVKIVKERMESMMWIISSQNYATMCLALGGKMGRWYQC